MLAPASNGARFHNGVLVSPTRKRGSLACASNNTSNVNSFISKGELTMRSVTGIGAVVLLDSASAFLFPERPPGAFGDVVAGPRFAAFAAVAERV